MASPVADVFTAPAGQTLYAGRFPAPSVLSASVAEACAALDAVTWGLVGAPLVVTFDPAALEHIGLRAVLTRAVASGTTAQVQYRDVGASVWTDGLVLPPIFAADTPSYAPGGGGVGAEPGDTPADGFAGCIWYRAPGTSYEVRIKVVEPGQPVAYTAVQTAATRALPAALPAVNKTCTPATIGALLAGLNPGDHLQLQAGNYGQFNLTRSGTVGSPIFISAAAGAALTYAGTDADAGAINLSASDIIFDGLVHAGSNVDSERAWMLAGTGTRPGVYNGFLSTFGASHRITVRNCSITGIDRFLVHSYYGDQWSVYNNYVRGNNQHDVLYTLTGDGYPNAGWNDHCCKLPGSGHEVYANDIKGFGDTLKVHSSNYPGGIKGRNTHFHRNVVRSGADDMVEFDNGTGNCSSHDNWGANLGTLVSVDDTYEGPFFVFNNVLINHSRGPIKPTTDSHNVKVWHNTFVSTNKPSSNHGMAASYADGLNSRLGYANNLLVYRGSGQALSWAAPLAAADWQRNAWFPNSGFEVRAFSGSTQANLAAAQAAFAPQFAGDVVTSSNPFSATITLGADLTTEYTGTFGLMLAGGASPLNAGLPIVGINDGYTGALPTMGAVWGGQRAFTPGLPALNLVSGVWTPNRDGAGNVLQSDFDALPTMTWVEVAGTNNKLMDVQQTPIYGNSTGAVATNYLTGPWCGAAWDSGNKRLIFRGGGHVDSSPAETGVFGVSAKKMKAERLVDRSVQGTGPNYTDGNVWQYNRGSNTFENWTPGSGPSFDGTPWPLRNGLGSAPHTYWGLEHIPPATMVTLGFTGNVNGGLFCYFPFQIINLDTGLHTIPWWWYAGGSGQDPEVFWSTTYPVSVVNGTEVIFPYGYFYHARVALTEKVTTRWSSQIGGTQSDSKVYQAAGSGPGLANHGDCIVVKMQERGEYVNIFGGATPTGRRVRYAAARTAGVSDWTAYTDAITLTSSDGSHGDFTTVNLLDSSGSPLNAAGSGYDHSTGTIWLRGNLATGKLYSITGLGGSTWTVTRFNVTPRYGEQGTHGNYNKFAFVQFGAVKLLLSITGMDHPIQVCRIA